MEKTTNTNPLYRDIMGRRVLVRSFDAGVYFGTLTDIQGDTVRLERVRNIHYWEGAAALSQIAIDGLPDSPNTRVTMEVPSMVINRVCQILPLSGKADSNLTNYRVWKI